MVNADCTMTADSLYLEWWKSRFSTYITPDQVDAIKAIPGFTTVESYDDGRMLEPGEIGEIYWASDEDLILPGRVLTLWETTKIVVSPEKARIAQANFNPRRMSKARSRWTAEQVAEFREWHEATLATTYPGCPDVQKELARAREKFLQPLQPK